MITIHPLPDTELPWGVYENNKLIAAFKREHAADAYRMQLNRAIKKVSR